MRAWSRVDVIDSNLLWSGAENITEGVSQTRSEFEWILCAEQTISCGAVKYDVYGDNGIKNGISARSRCLGRIRNSIVFRVSNEIFCYLPVAFITLYLTFTTMTTFSRQTNDDSSAAPR